MCISCIIYSESLKLGDDYMSTHSLRMFGFGALTGAVVMLFASLNTLVLLNTLTPESLQVTTVADSPRETDSFSQPASQLGTFVMGTATWDGVKSPSQETKLFAVIMGDGLRTKAMRICGSHDTKPGDMVVPIDDQERFWTCVRTAEIWMTEPSPR